MRNLGRTELQVSELTFGAMRIAESELDNGVSRALLHALERGVTCIDTARAYGGSEQIIGKTLQAWSGTRPVIMSKVAPLPGASWSHPTPMNQAFTIESIERSVEDSLRTLGIETIDVLQLHQWYYLWTRETEWLEAMRRLRHAGKIRYFGISCQDHEHDAALELVASGAVDTVQLIFNIFESRPLNAILPLAEEKGVGVIARVVLDCGGLTETMSDEALAEHPLLKHLPASMYVRRRNMLREEYCSDQLSLTELALRFAITPDAVSTLAVSMPDAQTVDGNCAAVAKGPLPAVVFERLRNDHAWMKNNYRLGWLRGT